MKFTTLRRVAAAILAAGVLAACGSNSGGSGSSWRQFRQ